MKKMFPFLILNIVLFVYSFSGFFSKTAATYEFLSIPFVVFYGLSLFLLVVYTFFWQKILKHIPLNIAYANKAVTIIWGVMWGKVFFDEKLSFLQIVGAVIIVFGVIITITGGEKQNG